LVHFKYNAALHRAALNVADIQIIVCDCGDLQSVAAAENMIKELSICSNKAPSVMVVMNKIDSIENLESVRNRFMALTSVKSINASFHEVSCRTGAGLDEWEFAFEKGVKALVYGAEGESNESLLQRLTGITRLRHRHHVEQCVEHLKQFLSIDSGEYNSVSILPLDVRAEELRFAILIIYLILLAKFLKLDWQLQSLVK
jgi:tRNA U34 5-carboxymethylaminomethyl modifying GTPase MnmE/TrmE